MSRNSTRAWQRMLSGRRLDILDPSPVDVELSDIAHGLARVARWNGQTLGDYPFSVAQHSVLVLEHFRSANPEIGPVQQLPFQEAQRPIGAVEGRELVHAVVDDC